MHGQLYILINLYLRAQRRLTSDIRTVTIFSAKFLDLEPFSKKSMELWVSDLAAKCIKHASILSHLSAVKHCCLTHDLSIDFAASRLRLVLRGIENSGAVGYI